MCSRKGDLYVQVHRQIPGKIKKTNNKRGKKMKKSRGFTLIELLVNIA